MCVCSLSYPACNAHAPSCIAICGLSDSTIFFPHYLINGEIFGKKFIEREMFVLILFTVFSETLPKLKRIQWHRAVHSIITVHRASWKLVVILVKIQRKLYLSKDFRKIPRYQIWWKSVQWVASCPTQTGRHMWGSKQSIAAILRKRLNRIM